jgi:hypothetical protein
MEKMYKSNEMKKYRLTEIVLMSTLTASLHETSPNSAQYAFSGTGTDVLEDDHIVIT